MSRAIPRLIRTIRAECVLTSDFQKRYLNSLHPALRAIWEREDLPIREKSRLFREECDRLEAWYSSNRPAVSPVTIKGVGEFEPDFHPHSHDIIAFKSKANFRGFDITVCIYPDTDYCFADRTINRLDRQYTAFAASFPASLASYPKRIRRLCDRYGIDSVKGYSDSDLVGGLVFDTVKLESPRRIECYTNDYRLSEDFDIVLVFKRSFFGQPSWKACGIRFDG